MIRELAELLAEVDLTEIEIEQDDLRVRVSRNNTAGANAFVNVPSVATAPQPAPAPAAEPANSETPEKSNAITSPMVGTVYLSPEPGAPQFVSIGDKVSKGQTLLIVEAMKTMNPITAPAAGTVAEILVENEQPVEFGEGLIVVE